MNLYQVMWDVRGYGKRQARIWACAAPESRKLAALQRLWARMLP